MLGAPGHLHLDNLYYLLTIYIPLPAITVLARALRVSRRRILERVEGRCAARHPCRLAVLLGCLAGFVLVPAGASSAVGAFQAVNLTGIWNCCGSGGAAAQVWVITSGTGSISGIGKLPGGRVFATLSGSVSGGRVTVIATYNDFAPGYVGTAVGTVSADGNTMSGTWVSNANQSGTWTATRSGRPPSKGRSSTKPSGTEVCVPADCSGFKFTVDPSLLAGLTSATLSAACGGGGASSSICDIDAALELDLKNLQSSDEQTQLRAQKGLEKDLAAFNAKVTSLESDGQAALREIERDAAAMPPNEAALQKGIDAWGTLMDEASGQSAALDAAEAKAFHDLSSADPAIQQRGQQELADVQAQFQTQVDRMQSGAQAVETALQADSPGAQQVPDNLDGDLSKWQGQFQKVANDAASIDAAQEQAYRDLASPDSATQLRGQQEMQRVQESLQAEINQIRQTGQAAKDTIRQDGSDVPGAVTQDVDSWAARFQSAAGKSAALDAREAQAYRDLSSSDPQVQLRGQQELQSVQAGVQQLSNEIQQDSASAVASIQGDAAITPGSDWVDETATGTDNWFPSYDTSSVEGPTGFDGSTGPLYPAEGSGVSAGVLQRVITAAGIRVPEARAVIDSIYLKHPTRANMEAFGAALKLATAKKYSPLRAKARLELTLAQHIGHAELVHELGYDLHTRRGGHSPVILGHTGAHIQSGSKRKITIRSTTLGGRILRLLDIYSLSHHTSIRLHTTSKHGEKTSTTSKPIAIR